MSVATDTMFDSTLYEHTKRPEWGFGILAAEDATHRQFQFQDGKLRTIKRGYYELLKEVPRPPEDAPAVVAELVRNLDVSLAKKREEMLDPGSRSSIRDLDEQIEIFRAAYPDGFGGDAWRKKHRGVEGKKHLKRHRDGAIAEAAEAFSAARMTELINTDDHQQMWNVVVGVLENTDLVKPSTDLKPLEGLNEASRRAAVEALFMLLHGEGDPSERFDGWVRALSPTEDVASWSLATAPAALFDPRHHVPVSASTLKRQARSLAPRMAWTKRPTGHRYVELLQIAHTVQRGLFRAELTPRDMLDVHDFMAETLKPSAGKK